MRPGRARTGPTRPGPPRRRSLAATQRTSASCTAPTTFRAPQLLLQLQLRDAGLRPHPHRGPRAAGARRAGEGGKPIAAAGRAPGGRAPGGQRACPTRAQPPAAAPGLHALLPPPRPDPAAGCAAGRPASGAPGSITRCCTPVPRPLPPSCTRWATTSTRRSARGCRASSTPSPSSSVGICSDLGPATSAETWGQGPPERAEPPVVGGLRRSLRHPCSGCCCWRGVPRRRPSQAAFVDELWVWPSAARRCRRRLLDRRRRHRHAGCAGGGCGWAHSCTQAGAAPRRRRRRTTRLHACLSCRPAWPAACKEARCLAHARVPPPQASRLARGRRWEPAAW